VRTPQTDEPKQSISLRLARQSDPTNTLSAAKCSDPISVWNSQNKPQKGAFIPISQSMPIDNRIP